MKLTDKPLVEKINRFLASPFYIVALTGLCAAAHLLSAELVAYTVMAAVSVYVCLLGNDLLPLTPLFLFLYLTPSARNNPGRNAQSIFSGGSGIYLAVLVVLIVLGVIWYVAKNPARFFRTKRYLLPGMLILLGGYLLSGIGSAAYPAFTLKNLLFAAAQGACILVPYWLLTGGVDWERARKEYFAWIGFCAGGLLLIQLLWCYCTEGVIINGIIQRKQIYTGWGMYNNMGAMLAMMIPFAFYLASKYRRGWIGTVVGSAFLVGVLLTCSRTSLLAGTFIYVVCILLMLHFARNRRHNTVALVSFFAVAVVALALFHDQLLRLFSDFLSKRLDPSSRNIIYAEGLKLFAQAPVFGNSFYSPGYQPWDFSTVEAFSNLLPPRWHNTFVQLLASCGIVGLGAYLFHRYQTVRLFLQRFSKERSFIACSIVVLLLCSLLDCHFFNLGPAMFYSAALAFLECYPASE